MLVIFLILSLKSIFVSGIRENGRCSVINCIQKRLCENLSIFEKSKISFLPYDVLFTY